MGQRLSIAAKWFIAERRVPWLLLGLLLALRALVILAWVEPSSDAAWYFSRAAMLAQGRGYLGDHGEPTAFWPPGWPLVLSLVFRLTGPAIWAVGLFNLAMAGLAGWLTLDLGRRLFDSEAAGRIALLLWAIYPNAVLYVPLALTEVFYTTLLLALCWCLVARQGAIWTVLAGLILGLATLVKAQSLVVVPLILGISLWREGRVLARLPRLIGQGLLLGALAALVVLPWTLRNHREMGAWIAVSTNGGITLLTGNNDSARGGYTPQDPVVRALDARTDLSEMAYDAKAKALALDWIKAHPARFAALMPMKMAWLWGPDGDGQWAYETGSWAWKPLRGLFFAARLANQAGYWALLGLFIAAFPLVWRQRRAKGLRAIDWWLLPYGIAAYPSLIALVFSGQSRFHYPVMPFICIVAGWGIAQALVARDSKGPLR